MELLNTYSTARVNTNTYNLTYTFPDNCNAVVSHKDGVYYVKITLKKGQTQPSAICVTDNIICDQCDGVIEVQFVQQDYDLIECTYGNGTSTKPSVKIFING